MTDFSERQQKIITIITNHNDYVTCKQIENEIGFSRRTILNEINEINRIKPIIISSNRGYRIDREALNEIRVESIPDIRSEHDLLRRLMLKNKTYSFKELQDKLYISETTLNKTLKEISPFVSSFGLSIKRSKGQISIEGNEFNKRRLINYLINEEIDENFKSLGDIDELVEGIDTIRVQHIIDTSIEQFGYYVDTNYTFNMTLNVIIALYRMKNNLHIDEDIETSVSSDSDEYRIAEMICDQYSNHSYINVREEDVRYIASLLSGQLRRRDNKEQPEPIISNEFINEIDVLLMETFSYFMIEASYSDLLYPFALHIDAMLKRIRNNQIIINDLLGNIKKNSPFIYEVAIYFANKVNQKYNVRMPDEEIGFVSVHLGFVINNSIQKFNKVKILLLCNDYHNILNTITTKIMSKHSDYVDIIPYDISFNPIRTDFDVDLIISTKMINVVGKKLIIITPFYSIVDSIQVDDAINEVLASKEKSYRNLLLSSFFHEDLFFKTDRFQNKEEVINFMGQKIIDFGLTDDRFIQSVQEREKISSTCFFDTFAIPHAIDVFSNKSMFCILTSEKGIMWDDTKIHIVLMLAVHLDDRKEFVNIYNGIIKALWDKDKTDRLINANTLAEFIEVLK